MSLYCYHCMNKLTEKDNVCPYCGKNNSFEVPVHHLLPGTILNSKFMVGEALGEGGFGITYIGRDMNLDIPVAVKEFYPNGFVSRNNTASQSIVDSISEDRKDFFIKGRERFLTESRILAKFSDEPGIVEVRDFFEENNTAYIVMEYLDGCNLKNYIKKNGLMTPEQALNFLFPVMEALKKIHSHGLIHRDISPDNIMYTGKAVKLLDFGAARSVTAEANKSLSVMLKPGFTPEEQYRSKGVQGPWTDIYALCATMYKLITGITPEDATQRFFDDSIKRPSQLGIKIAPNVEDAIVKGMSLKQSDRFQTIDELLDALTGAVTKTEEKTVTSQTIGNVFETEDKTTEQKTIYNGETIVPPLTKTEMLTSVDTSATQLKNDVASSASYPAENFVSGVNNTPENSTAVVNALTQKKSSVKKIIVILLTVLLLVGGAVLAFFLLQQEDSDEGGSSSIAESSTLADRISDVLSTENSVSKDNSENTVVAEETTEVQGDVFPAFDCSVFYIEGKQYTLPCSAKVFTDDGWESYESVIYFSEDGAVEELMPEDVECNGLGSCSAYLKKGDNLLYVECINRMSVKRDLSDCDIVFIKARSDEIPSFTVDRGMNICADKETLTSLLPEMKAVSSTGNWEYYYSPLLADNDAWIDRQEIPQSFCFMFDGDVTVFKIKNNTFSEDDYTIPSSAPTESFDYPKPDSFGVLPNSSIISIDGKLYNFPAPVSEFTADGWTLVSVNEYPLGLLPGGAWTENFILKKGDRQIDIDIDNPFSEAAAPEYCYVTGIDISPDDSVEVILSCMDNKNIFEMQWSEIKSCMDSHLKFDSYDISTFSQDYSYEVRYDFSPVGYSDGYMNVSVADISYYIDNETGKVNRLMFNCWANSMHSWISA